MIRLMREHVDHKHLMLLYARGHASIRFNEETSLGQNGYQFA